MKTLAQVEPRTAISGPVTITQPGSYYLASNISVSSGDIITITTNNVKLDLKGFALTSTDVNGGSRAIYLSGSLTNITIVNGLIYSSVTNNGTTSYGGSGFGSGIYSYGTAYNVRIKGVQVYGCRQYGIYLSTDTPTLVKDCTVNNIGASGITADMVLDSSANVGGYAGNASIQANTVCNCRGVSYGTMGIRATHNVYNSYGSSTNSYGIYSSVVVNCYGVSTGQVGIFASVVNNSSGTSVNADGIYTYLGCNSVGSSSSTFSYAFYTVFLAVGCQGYGPDGIYSQQSLVSCAGSNTGSSYKYCMP